MPVASSWSQLCSIFVTRATLVKTVLISVAVFAASSENRIICREAVESGFIAFTTCDGSSESAKQAEPDAAQMPS